MKNILFIRHADTELQRYNYDDLKRNLTDRGKIQVQNMSNKLSYKGICPELFISSPSNRTLQTASIMKESLRLNVPIEIDKEIYSGGIHDLSNVVTNISNKIELIAIFGHNPTMSNIANLISKKSILGFPTCSVLHCSYKINSWVDFQFSEGIMLSFDIPDEF